MKYIISFLVLSVTASAAPRFVVDDCINPSRYEGIPIRPGTCYHKVTAVGKRAYECAYTCGSEVNYFLLTFEEAVDMVKVGCPK